MGSIKKIRKKYSKPAHPWRSVRIEEENQICKDYGIPKKTEVWKTIAKLESYKNQIKKLSSITNEQSNKEMVNLIAKLKAYSLIQNDTSDEILGITLKNLLDRRLQTIVFKKNYAKGMKQARQLIIHRHILVNNKIISSPSYLVKLSEEANVEISPKSPFYDTAHPERTKEASKRTEKKPVKDQYAPRGRRRKN
jgi:small subunit ribosomal protein S4